MKYPEFLTSNGTIGFVAPSFGCNISPYQERFVSALHQFEERGHHADVGPNCFAGEGIGISNTPVKCGQELTNSYLSDENQVLISCGGGEMMCEVMDYVDFLRIEGAKPKWFMGYSDNTNMTFLLTTLCDTASLYGPNAANFGMKPWDESFEDAYQVLCGLKTRVHGYPKWEPDPLPESEIQHLGEPEDPLSPYHLINATKYQYFGCDNQSVSFSGRMIGGCLDVLVNLVGTKYDKTKEFVERYKEDGIIWFLECCDLNTMQMRRAIWQLKTAGWLTHVKGFLIGRPFHFQEDCLGLDQYHAVYDLLEEFHVPVIMDVDIGHLPPMMTIVCGSLATVIAQENNIDIQYTFE